MLESLLGRVTYVHVVVSSSEESAEDFSGARVVVDDEDSEGQFDTLPGKSEFSRIISSPSTPIEPDTRRTNHVARLWMRTLDPLANAVPGVGVATADATAVAALSDGVGRAHVARFDRLFGWVIDLVFRNDAVLENDSVIAYG